MSRGSRRLWKVLNRALRITHWMEIATVSCKEVSTIKIPVVTICTASLRFKKFYVLPTQCIYVFCVDLRTNSDYFPIQH